jgi:serine/threonine protein kinase
MSASAPSSTGSAKADPALAALFDELTNWVLAGQAIDEEELLRAHPEQADQLRELLPALRLLAEFGRSQEGEDERLTDPANDSGEALGSLGDFRLIREVGRGGMGVVYEAEQVSLSRRVALKVLPFAGALDAKQLQRFKNEAQAAAHLQHQHIVPVHFVGCERSVHFYAMQYVDGWTLAQVIAELRCTPGKEPADRPSSPAGTAGRATTQPAPASPGASTIVELQARSPTERPASKTEYFRRVARWGIEAAEALEHAHQLGVVHRDVKPANLLVDGRGHLWVTDFGLARMQSEGNLTLSGDLVGTLRYMSPEQALANRVLIDHRTDIYSLGATLYELLTLRPAFEGNDRQELLRQIAFTDPPAPHRLNTAVSAELETVVLKALEKRPEDRYATAQELADDLRRILDDQPIRARRPKFVHQVAKWCRRHKAIVRMTAGSAALLLLAVTAALAVGLAAVERERDRTKWERDQAETARRLADEEAATVQEVNAFYQNYVLRQASIWVQAKGEFTPEPNLTVKAALGRAAKHISGRFRKRPFVEATIRQGIGHAYLHLADPGLAIEHLKRSLDLRRANLKRDHPKTLHTMQVLALAYRHAGQIGKAVALNEEVLVKRQKTLGPDHHDTLNSMHNLATAYDVAGLGAKALRLRKEVLARYTATLGANHLDTLASMDNLAFSYAGLGHRHKAITLRERAIEKLKANVRPNHPATLICMFNLGSQYVEVGQLHRGIRLLEQALKGYRATFGADHPETANCMNNLANAYRHGGHPQKAVQLHKEALASRQTNFGPDSPAALHSMNNLACAYIALGQTAKALTLFKDVLAKRQKKLGPDNPDTLDTLENLAGSYAALGQPAKAAPLLERLLDNRTAKLGRNHPRNLITIFNLATAYEQVGQFEKAIKLHEEALSGRKAQLGSFHPDTLESMNNLGVTYASAGQPAKALPLLEEALAKRQRKLGPNHPDTLDTMDNLANAYGATGQTAKAVALHEEVLAKCRIKLGNDDPRTLQSMNNLANDYSDTRQWTKAIPLYEEFLARWNGNLGLDHAFRLRLMHRLAWLLANCEDASVRNPTRAVEIATRASQENPNKHMAWAGLVLARYRAGDWKGCLQALEKSRQLHQGGSFEWFVAAMTHWQLGEKKQARKWYDRAVIWMEKSRLNGPGLRGFRSEAAALIGVQESAKTPSKDRSPQK